MQAAARLSTTPGDVVRTSHQVWLRVEEDVKAGAVLAHDAQRAGSNGTNGGISIGTKSRTASRKRLARKETLPPKARGWTAAILLSARCGEREGSRSEATRACKLCHV